MPSTIRFVNATGADIAVKNAVAPSLDQEYWSSIASDAPYSPSPTDVLKFDREEGIKDGHTWIFTTSVELDGVPIKLEEKLEGQFLHSDLSQQMSAGSTSTGFQNTDDDKSISFIGASGTEYSLSWHLSEALDSFPFKDIEYTLKVAKPAYKPTATVMPQIETVVYIMMENRSLDNVLGWLYDGKKPNVVYPKGSSPEYNGISSDDKNEYDGQSYSPSNGTASYGKQAWRIPENDPFEPFDNVKKQLYADSDGNMPEGDFWSKKPPMTGFAWDYRHKGNIAQVMGAYTGGKDQLPVLNGIAFNFAVSDRWFCSLPTQTDPNRAFSICGTSLGKLANKEIDKETYKNALTMFNALGQNGKSWGVYYQSDNPLGTGEITSFRPFTSYYFSNLKNAPNGDVYKYSEFLSALDAGTLPNFAYIEPWWGLGIGGDGWFVGLQGNDYHPPAWVGPAEAFLNDLYKRIVSSPQWGKMLFVIAFDEHGGTYDHEPPTCAPAPDSIRPVSGFDFNRLGVRVPMILVSPYIPKGTVFRAPAGAETDLDHTSFVATMLKWAGVNPSSAGLGARVATAPTFEGVLTEEARLASTYPAAFEVPSDYADQGGGTGKLDPSLGGTLSDVDIHEFREALDDSSSPEEFVKKLREAIAR